MLTVFMLHQCAELTLRAFINAFVGLQINIHAVSSLLHHVRRFAPALLQPFAGSHPNNQRLLQLLDKAYTDARYEAAFTVSAADTKLLLKKVKRLNRLARQFILHPLKNNSRRYKGIVSK